MSDSENIGQKLTILVYPKIAKLQNSDGIFILFGLSGPIHFRPHPAPMPPPLSQRQIKTARLYNL